MVWKRENPQTQGRSAFFINPITTSYFVVQKGATRYFKMNINDMILWIKNTIHWLREAISQCLALHFGSFFVVRGLCKHLRSQTIVEI